MLVETYGYKRRGRKGRNSEWLVPCHIAWHTSREVIAAFANIKLANLPEQSFASKQNAIAYIESSNCSAMTAAKMLSLARARGFHLDTAKADYQTRLNFQNAFADLDYLDAACRELVRREKISQSLQNYHQQRNSIANHQQLKLF